MSKYYSQTRRPPPPKRPWKVHPIWRGIGCIMILIMPILSYAGAVLLVGANMQQHWVPLPHVFTQSIFIPYLGRIPHLAANLMATLVLMLIGFGFIVMLYAFLYRLMGPPPLGPMDAPPIRGRVRRSR